VVSACLDDVAIHVLCAALCVISDISSQIHRQAPMNTKPVAPVALMGLIPDRRIERVLSD
jgi:hypothetical protein